MGERSYQKDTIRFGVGGIDLRRSVDEIPQNRYACLKNVMRAQDGAFTTRPGQTAINAAAVGSNVHSIFRLDDPQNNTWARVLGIDSGLHIGQSTFSQIDTGYSGNPLSILAYRPYMSGDAWAFIADSQRMRKVRRDGLDLPIGLHPPVTAMIPIVNAENVTDVDDCSGGWGASTWGTMGVAVSYVPGVAAPPYGDCVKITMTPASEEDCDGKGIAFKEISLDLSKVGAVDSVDDDLIHLWLAGGSANLGADTSEDPGITSVDIYFICGLFNSGWIPGTSVGGGSGSADYYQYTIAGSELTEDWVEYGTYGKPLRKVDFTRHGDSPDCNWSTITGIIVVVTQNSPAGTWVALDNITLRGGSGVDSTPVGASKYDWRYTHYDPRTGAESNPSPIYEDVDEELISVDVRRQTVTLVPEQFEEEPEVLDPGIRQRFYRRGGTLVDNWYYLGCNATNGENFTDDLSDTEIATAGTLALDHDRPITTADTSGDAVYGQNLPYIAGPLGGLYLFGCGDPYRKGDLYWSRPGEPDHWPAASHQEVCAPSEELLAPLMYNGTGFVFSRARMFQVYYNLSASGSTVTTVPTACGHGVAGPWAFCVGPEIYFCSRDGIYATSGGVERSLSEDDIAPLFHREWILRDASSSYMGGSGYGEGGYGEGGYGEGGASSIATPPPIDWDQENQLRLEVFENDLYFTYQDTTGYIQTLVYNLPTQEWRWYLFGKSPVCLSAEKCGQDSRLLIGSNNGKVYEHTGFSDDSVQIHCIIRSGARKQDAPRNEKLYGDLVVDSDPKTATITVRSYLNPSETFLTHSTISGTGRDLTIHDHFPGGQLGRTTTTELTWSCYDSRPLVYSAEVGFFVDPERTARRATDWDDIGSPGEKLVKGVIIEANTFGADKILSVQADGVEQTQLTLNNNGRLQSEFTFEAFQGKLVRVVPTTSTEWLLYGIKWISEPVPYGFTRWESRPLDLGVFGYMIHFDAYITLKSTAETVFSLILDGSVVQEYVAPSTNGVVRKLYVPFVVNKALLAQYVLTSTNPVMVYKSETHVRIYPWGQENYIIHHPFGGDDLDEAAR
jgi:hypothetical protein